MHTAARSQVVALRPAPLTVLDQGFAGSSGGIVSLLNADAVSAPPEYAHFYSGLLLLYLMALSELSWLLNCISSCVLR